MVKRMVPVSYFDPLFDHRIDPEMYIDNVLTVKRGLFFIHLDKYLNPNDSKSKSQNTYGSKFGALVGHIWSHLAYRSLKNSVKPTILSFRWDGVSQNIKETLKITCIGYQFWTSAMLGFPKEDPLIHFTNPQRFYYTHSILGRFLVLNDFANLATSIDLVYKSESTGWLALEKLSAKCENDIILHEPLRAENCKTKTKATTITQTKSKSITKPKSSRRKIPDWLLGPGAFRNTAGFYFLDLNTLCRFTAEQVLVEILSPNSTNVAKQGLLNNAGTHPQFTLVETPNFATYFLHHDSKPLKFITCLPLEKSGVLTLLGYISSFDLATWCTLIVMGIGSRILIQIGFEKNYGQETKVTLWQIGTYIYHTLLGMESPQLNQVRWLSGSWLISGIILSYYYKGDNIDQIIAPITPSRLGTFDELLHENFSIYTFFVGIDDIKKATEYDQRELVVDNKRFVNGSLYYKSFLFNPILMPFVILYGRKNRKVKGWEAWKKVNSMLKLPQDEKEAFEFNTVGYLSRQIGRCQKEAYVDTVDKVLGVKQAMILGGIKRSSITISKDSYGDMFDEWRFENFDWPADKLNLRVRSVFESGIVAAWKRWIKRVTTWNNTVLEKNELAVSQTLKGISLEDNAVVVFYIHLFILFVAWVTFLYEIRKQLWNTGKLALTYLYKCLRTCRKRLRKKCKRTKRAYTFSSRRNGCVR